MKGFIKQQWGGEENLSRIGREQGHEKTWPGRPHGWSDICGGCYYSLRFMGEVYSLLIINFTLLGFKDL